MIENEGSTTYNRGEYNTTNYAFIGVSPVTILAGATIAKSTKVGLEMFSFGKQLARVRI